MTLRKTHVTSEASSIRPAASRNAAVAPSVNTWCEATTWAACCCASESAGPPAAAAFSAAALSTPTRSSIVWVATVPSNESPSAPPTCCMVFSTPEPMPVSSLRRWCTAVSVSGTKVIPMPKDISRMNGSRSVT